MEPRKTHIYHLQDLEMLPEPPQTAGLILLRTACGGLEGHRDFSLWTSFLLVATPNT